MMHYKMMNKRGMAAIIKMKLIIVAHTYIKLGLIRLLSWVEPHLPGGGPLYHKIRLNIRLNIIGYPKTHELNFVVEWCCLLMMHYDGE